MESLTHDATAKLPPLPLLTGHENFQQWRNLVVLTFDYYGILDYILTPGRWLPHGANPRGQRKKKQTSIFAVILLSNSVSPVMSRLVEVGWKLGKKIQNPRHLWKLVMKCFPLLSGVDEKRLAADLRGLDASGSTTLAEFRDKLGFLKRRLDRIDGGVGLYVVHEEISRALAHRSPRLSIRISVLKESKVFTWATMMCLVDEEIARQLSLGNHYGFQVLD